jgi:hypothetical protein
MSKTSEGPAMNEPKPKPHSPAEAIADLVEEAEQDEELERMLRMSDAEVARELAEQGQSSPAVDRAARRLRDRTLRRGSGVTRWVLLAAALVAAALLTPPLVTAIANRNRPDIGPDNRDLHRPGPPDDRIADQRTAATLRDRAVGDCAASNYDACKRSLDEAMRLDPAGETGDPRVSSLRRQIASALLIKNEEKKRAPPPGPTDDKVPPHDPKVPNP